MDPKKEEFKLGTVVYIDGITSHMGMIGGYTTDKWGDKAYLFAASIIDGSLAMNNEGEDENFVCPVEICVEATNEDTQFFFLKLMNKNR